MKHPHLLIFSLLALLQLPASLLAQVPAASAPREEMIALGLQHETAEALFETLKARANGGSGINNDSIPDWTGIYSTDIFVGFNWDSAQQPGEAPTAKLTPEYQEKFDKKMALVGQGIEFDPQGDCRPPGVPRWFQEPFLREFIVTPNQTWMINEVFNEIRRIYTDGREHLPELDRFPTFDGDSIGFWDGDKLVIHTNQLRDGQYQRQQPDYSEQVEVVEIWQKTDAKTLSVHVWAYDPPALQEPWYGQKKYLKLSDPDKLMRIHYWYCFDGQNNDVTVDESGATQFLDFDFTDSDDK